MKGFVGFLDPAEHRGVYYPLHRIMVVDPHTGDKIGLCVGFDTDCSDLWVIQSVPNSGVEVRIREREPDVFDIVALKQFRDFDIVERETGLVVAEGRTAEALSGLKTS